MERTRQLIVVAALTLAGGPLLAQAPARTLTDAEMEQFLRKARVVSTRPTGRGTTKSLRATLTDGTLTHDAQIQLVNGVARRGGDFRDTWRYNVAAYRLDRMLGLHLVPVSVERLWHGERAAFTWWVDDVMMDERERQTSREAPPDADCWTAQTQALRLFDQLIENTDRHPGNILISRGWRVWAIDHTRAFRHSPEPANPAALTVIDKDVLARLESLQYDSLTDTIGQYVQAREIRALLSRRDALVAHYRARASVVTPGDACPGATH